MSEREGPQRERDAKTVRPVAPLDGAGNVPAPGGPAEKPTQIVLDCRGRRCPLPVIELAKHIGSVEPGAVLAVAADDPAARLDVPAWCRMRGQEYLGEAVFEGDLDEARGYDVRRTT